MKANEIYIVEDNTGKTELPKEQAERLYRQKRASGEKVDIYKKKIEPYISGFEVEV